MAFMKKLNTLVAAPLLGLTVSFAVLSGVASAHSPANAHGSNVTHAHQQNTSAAKNYRSDHFRKCKPTRIKSIAGGPVALTTTFTPIPGESFTVPSNCAFTMEDQITVHQTGQNTPENFPSTVTCQLVDSRNNVIGHAENDIDEDASNASFPLNANVEPTRMEDEYSIPVTYHVECKYLPPSGTTPTDLTIRSSGNVVIGQPVNTCDFESEDAKRTECD
ncbi:hypothetical protein KDW_57440 [Dictyobacter vulcani]|uniref:Uncharacterized protein n=1 Tax=Dictyobacter vulcani TaxID=2607529 RepID=A0A5J4KWQ6_9CHLR|nr:hypothetical protein KDW_57440 [Dictyobacter vulcani]